MSVLLEAEPTNRPFATDVPARLDRLITGLAIGGEYAAINSAIDELIPARVRGRVDLAVNSTFWLGAILGAGLSVVLLDPSLVPLHVGWRVAFGLGSVAALAMI